MEGDKICNDCGHKKIEHLYVWINKENQWVCPIMFFDEAPSDNTFKKVDK